MKEINSNYYEILEIDPSSSSRDVTRAYIRLKAAYGENSLVTYTGVEDEERRVTLAKIEEAYLVLSRSEKRRVYDNVHNIEARQSEKCESFEPKIREYVEPKLPKFRINPEFEEEIVNQASFDGLFLKKIREYRRITLDDISQYTKISKNYLEFIESEEFSKFTALAYMKGFLKEYSKYLKLDPTKVCNSYLERINRK